MKAIVATDLSEPSLLSIDGLCQCGPMPFEHISLVHIIDLDLYTAGGSIPELLDWAARELVKQAERLTSCGMDVSTRVEQGDAVDQLLYVAEDEGAELIMLTSRGKSGLTERFFGSTAEKLAANGRVPVLVERIAMQEQTWCRIGERPFSSVLLATALDEELPLAFDFVTRLPGVERLRVVHVAEDEQQAAMAEPLIGALKSSTIAVESAVLRGEPAEAIAADVAAWQPALVCVTPKTRGLERVLRGSVSSKLVADTTSGVLFMPSAAALTGRTAD